MLKFGSKHDSNIVYKCTVRLLEDTEILDCEYRPHDKGKSLLDHVCQQLNLVEQDYLGLRYVDNHGQRHWLDLGKSILKQVKDLDPVLFSFRIKFYPPDPFRLKEEITRYQIFLQLKRDLLHGRLYCSTNEAAMLMALIVQGELGDYDPEIHVGRYVSDFKILLKQTETIEDKSMEIHQRNLKGQDQSQVENSFLKLACQLDTYGVDPHPVKDHKGTQLYLGINYSGILTFQGSRKTHHFRWPDIQKINYEGKMFIIHLNYSDGFLTTKYGNGEMDVARYGRGTNYPFTLKFTEYYWYGLQQCVFDDFLIGPKTRLFRLQGFTGKHSYESLYLKLSDGKKHTVGFKCPTGAACRHIWRCAMEQMLFFTLPTSSDAPPVVTGGGFFSWGTKFKYTGRTEREILDDTDSPRKEPNVQRTSSTRRKASSVPATPSTPLQPHLGYSSLPRSSHSDIGGSRMECSSSIGLLSGLDGNFAPAYNDVAALETVCEDQEAIGGKKLLTTVLKDDSIDRFSDYYFRDSFEHSSSESQLVDNSYRYDTTNPSHRSSRSQTPLSHSHGDGHEYLPSNTPTIQNPHQKNRKFNLIGALILTVSAVTIFVFLAIVVFLELDYSFLRKLRNIPEFFAFRYYIYESIKSYFRNILSFL